MNQIEKTRQTPSVPQRTKNPKQSNVLLIKNEQRERADERVEEKSEST